MRRILYEIEHVTRWGYVGNVSVSHMLMCLTPRNDARQLLLNHKLELEPGPSALSAHSDYFGNTAHFAAIDRSHSEMVIRSSSRVAVGPAFVPEASETPPWEIVRSQCRMDRTGQALEANEFSHSSPMAPVDREFAELGSQSFLPDRPILDAVMHLTGLIAAEFKFDPEATRVSTPVSEVLRLKRGVCQDFAHLQIACLRSLGLPARYISGYIETDPPPGQMKLRGADASHAWVSFYCPGIGWIDVDPTNNCFPSMRHITIGWGRDYADVSPVRGVLVGGSGQDLSVSVDVVAMGSVED